MEILSLLLVLFQLLLVVTLPIFIVFSACKNLGKRKQFMFTSIASFSIFVIILVSYLLDVVYQITFDPAAFYGDDLYIALMAISGGYALLSLILMIVKFKDNERYYKVKPVKKKMVYTYHQKIEYVYVFYRYQEYLYLLKDTHGGIRYKLKKMEFCDDAIKTINVSVGIKLDEEVDRRGIVTVKGEQSDDVYYCYLIDLPELMKIEMLDIVKSDELPTLPLMDFDKFIIFNSLIKDDFNEEY